MNSLGVLLIASLFAFNGSQVYAQDQTAPPPSQAPLDYTKLHPVFLLSPVEVQKCIDKGISLAKKGKKFENVFSENSKKPRGIKGEKGTSHESLVVCYNLYGSDIVFNAFEATNKYEKTDFAQRFPNGIFVSRLDFFVSLVSEPRIGATIFDKNRTAREADVKVIKFVLTDEKDNVIARVDPSVDSKVKSGVMEFSGGSVVPQVQTQSSTSSTYGNVYGDANLGFNGTTNNTATKTTYKYIPWSAERPYFEAQYSITFPLFDLSGRPLLTPAAKKLRLHIVLENGERMVEYDLKK